MIDFSGFFTQYPRLQQEKITELVILGIDLQEDVLGQMVELFNESSLEIINGIHQAYQNKDSSELAALAHKFKSGAGNIGLMKLHHMCTYLEKGIKENSLTLDECSSLIVSMEKEFHEGMGLLQRYHKVG